MDANSNTVQEAILWKQHLLGGLNRSLAKEGFFRNMDVGEEQITVSGTMGQHCEIRVVFRQVFLVYWEIEESLVR